MANGPGFSIAGIPVRIQPVFFVVILVLGIFNPPAFIATWVLIATVSILVHELGHAVAFRAFGLHPRITLHGMGGVTAATGDVDTPTFSPSKSIITSLAGPLSALVLFGLPALYYAQQHGFDPWVQLRLPRFELTPAEIIIGQIVYINVGWSLLNLIPVLPLDGGNVTASVCELVLPQQGRRVAGGLSIVFSVFIAFWGYQYVGVVAPIFALVFIGLNISELAKTRGDDTDQDLSDALRALVEYDPLGADRLAQTVIGKHPSSERLGWATELSAWARLATGDAMTAQQILTTMPPGTAPSASIRGALALAFGRVPEGVATLTWALANDQARGAKILGAMAAVQSGHAVPIARELVLLQPAGVQATTEFASLLDYTGHMTEGAEVAQIAAYAAPRPPGW